MLILETKIKFSSEKKLIKNKTNIEHKREKPKQSKER